MKGDYKHHVMVRGIEGRAIFRDDRDRQDFVQRLGALADREAWRVYAWVLLPNHLHLLIRPDWRRAAAARAAIRPSPSAASGSRSPA